MSNIHPLEKLLRQPRFSDADVQYKVKLLVDPRIEKYYTQGSSWHERIAAGQLAVRRNYYDHFKIYFDFIETLVWEHNNPTLRHAMEEAEQIPRDDADIVIGLVWIQETQNNKNIGLAKINGRYCVINISGPWIITELHELGHLFGAEHSNNVASIMYPESLLLRSIWDDCNKQRILDNKYRFFDGGERK